MIKIRKSEDRGNGHFGWLNAKYSFSFSNYYDEEHMGFGPLRVINEDRVDPQSGFDTHGHRNMEIITYVIDGTIAHKDTLGNTFKVRPGEIQRMTAGSGIRHSEHNLEDDELHLLQIWILPEENGLEPSYEQIKIPDAHGQSDLTLIGSHDGRNGSVTIHQDVDLYQLDIEAGKSIEVDTKTSRLYWLQMVSGEITIDGEAVKAGDGVAISNQEQINFAATKDSKALFFDMAALN